MSAKTESPKDEMKRRIREIGGKASAGEKEDQLRDRATRRMNAELFGAQQINARRARSYWYGEIEDVPSHHMDRARALSKDTLIEEAINVLRAAKLRINCELEQLLDEVVSGVPNDPMDRRRLGDRRGSPHSAAGRMDQPAEVLSVRDVVRVRRDASAPATGARVTPPSRRATAH